MKIDDQDRQKQRRYGYHFLKIKKLASYNLFNVLIVNTRWTNYTYTIDLLFYIFSYNQCLTFFCTFSLKSYGNTQSFGLVMAGKRKQINIQYL